jgi:purine nucleoside permease
MQKRLITTFLVVLALSVVNSFSSARQRSESVYIKVLTIAVFEIGEMTGDIAGEAQFWIERENLTLKIKVPGAFSPIYCNEDGHCLVLTGMGISNATASIMSVGLAPNLDLRHTYFIVAGIAGTPPSACTIGSAAWAEWVVDGDLCHEIDAREMPQTWQFSRFHLGCSEPWCDGWKTGTEVFHLNPVLTEWAYRLSKDVELLDSNEAQDYRDMYSADLPARRAPFVAKCDNIAGSTYWHGKLASQWADWWMKQWTDGAGTYCMTNMEDSGILTALRRLSDVQRASFDRIMVLRTASDFDQQYPSQSAKESIFASSVGFTLAVENAYRVGSVVAHYIITNWNTWKNGVPPMK